MPLRPAPSAVAPVLPGLLASALLATGGGAWAGAAAEGMQAGVDALTRQFVQEQLAQEMPQETSPDAPPDTPPGALRVQVRVGAPARRHQPLTPCARVQPWLPAGQRPWGRLRLGLRCVEGAHWKMFLPVDVQVHGPGWVLRRDVPAGQVLGAEDAAPAEVLWSEAPQPVYARRQDWLGQRAARPLRAGRALRHGMLRQAPVVQAARPVRVQMHGAGFAVVATGKALGPAAPGQRLKVRLDSGRKLSGVAQPDGSVRVTP